MKTSHRPQRRCGPHAEGTTSPERAYAAEFRFYGPLSDFLPPVQRKQTLTRCFDGHPAIKDPIEACQVPHTEVELIIVNGQSVGFDYPLQHGDRVAVYPLFASFDLGALVRLREKPSNPPRFVLDVNLGKLARRMRMLGFDSRYDNGYQDAEIVDIAVNEQRIVLTRDRRLLHHRRITHGYWVRAVEVERQIMEVMRRFDLDQAIRPFARCLVCNGLLAPVAKESILDRLEPKTRLYYTTFFRCSECQRIYWKGSHVDDMLRRFADYLRVEGASDSAQAGHGFNQIRERAPANSHLKPNAG